MKSPFPGMDPYLEDPAFREGFHHVFITECMYLLAERLPEPYVPFVGERVELISRDDPAAEQYLPDVAVSSDRLKSRVPQGGQAISSGGTAVAVAPVTIPSTDSIEVREAFIKVLRMPDYKLITSIELLSPWNKFGDGLGEYRHKRRSLVNHGVHVVEIDLLRRGRRTELAKPLPAGHYYAFVFRADRQPDVNVYAWDMRQALPRIAIPLAAPDPDVELDLAAVVANAYARSRYDRKLRYSLPPPEPVSAVDGAWIADVTARAGIA